MLVSVGEPCRGSLNPPYVIRAGRVISNLNGKSLAVLPLRSALLPRYGRRPLPPVEHKHHILPAHFELNKVD